ncbi:hypothetical protein [Actinophytocola sp. NPDC049390]|uniref:hypothetical protein n=1 Tax=Actinophytocola sp. NPDC049390 TaxID=3363894 RepID=UPI0037903A07
MKCDRPKCNKQTTGDALYCSDRCFDLDNDPTPITVLARNKAGGFGRDLQWQVPDAVILPAVAE